MHRGFVKLWRKAWDTGFHKDRDAFVVFLYLVSHAAHKPVKMFRKGGYEFTLERGQISVSQKDLEAFLGLTRQQVRRTLEILASLRMVEKAANSITNKQTIFSIINYDTYQDADICEQPTEQPKRNHRGTTDQPTFVNKNEKNEKNLKKEQKRLSAPAALDPDFEQFWKVYPRKDAKAVAVKAWAKANGTRPPIEQILAKVEALSKTDQWTKDGGQFIPMPSTFINQRRWDDEVRKQEDYPQLEWQ